MAERGVPEFPPRYEPQRRLGAGAAGEVWSVRDRIGGRVLALKLLAADATEVELEVLVREASALSGLEGLGVPRVVAFGALPGGRRFMLREMVEGMSLDDALSRSGTRWLDALASACDQLTVVHRAGLLHGDLKPANVIVGDDGRGTLVDLGLAAAWKDGGPSARGLTPRYAAPEVLHGEAPSARAEVYALGVSLKEGLSRRAADLDDAARIALGAVAARATEPLASARWPSVDEFATALRRAAGLHAGERHESAPWPVVGIEAAARELLDRTLSLGPGTALAVDGARGSGRSTLVRRLAWTLGAQGHHVAVVDAPEGAAAMREALDLELAPPSGRGAGHAGRTPAYVVIDDAENADEGARATIRAALEAGARVVAVGTPETVTAIAGPRPGVFAVPRLDSEGALALVTRAIPSLPPALREHLVGRTSGCPGPLRAAVAKLAGKAIVSREDIDGALSGDSARPRFDRPAAGLDWADRALDTGRFDEAASVLDGIARAPGADEVRVRLAIARARVAIGRGDPSSALSELDSVEGAALAGTDARAWQALRARALVRAGRFAEATVLTDAVTAEAAGDALAADALSTRGVALAFTGDDAAARRALDRAIALARTLGDPRVEAIALGSLAIAHQRAGRTDGARASYEASLAAAEKARDAGTLAAMRLNLAGLLQSEGQLAEALRQLEAAVDLGQRAGSGAAVIQARLNLANLDLYLGRWARARESIELLARSRDELSAGARAQVLGLEAEYATRTTEGPRKPRDLYEDAAKAWDAQGRGHDAAEARLEGLLAAARAADADGPSLARDLEAIQAGMGESGFGEHAALAELLRGTLARLAGDEERARRALDAAVDLARKAGRREWAWQALDARARLATAQGAHATSRRDAEAALAMLEETAAHLPRDLREVFWNDPRRRTLRQSRPQSAPEATMVSTGAAGAITVTGTEDRLARVLEVTRELATEHDVPRLLQRVTDHAVALLGAERGFVLLVGDAGELEAHTARTRAGGDDPHGRFSRSVAERVLDGGEPVVTISARDDERLAEAISVHQLMIQSIACVPIRGAPPVGRTIGALYVETRLRPGVRFERELPTLRAFADQAAIAIENARLISENLARAEQLARANVELATARDELARTLGKRTEQLAEARRDLKQVRAELRGHFGYGGLVGTSASMRRLYAIIDRVKDTDVALLITGESGTGKEMVARVVHQAGPRNRKPFLGVNCGAIPANLLESELFGSLKGAFTGADHDRRGLFQEADGGTLLLDEIGEMPAKMQAGLLRVLQERQVRPVGGTREEPVDVRVMAATHCNLEKMVEEGTFRRDLYYRLHVIELNVPPLRDRVEDIPPLVDHFLARMCARYRRERKGLSREALRALCNQPWPGNVRQLEHVLLNAWLMSDDKEIGVADFELPSMQAARSGNGNGHASGRPRRGASTPRAETATEHKAAERERILGALTACNWNRAQAAKMIGVPRRTFYRRLREFDLL